MSFRIQPKAAVQILALAVVASSLVVGASGCKTTDPGSGIQIWQKNWEGSSDERSDAIVIKSQGIECGVDGRGDILFTPRDPKNLIQFPDGATIEAEGMKVLLKKTDQVSAIGVGPYEMELKLNGAIMLTGPFSSNIQAWFGEEPESGELTALFSGASSGPMVLRCPLHLQAIWVSGRSLIFGTVAREDSQPEEGATPEGQPAGEGTPADQPEDEVAPGEEPADEGTPGEQPADDGTPGEEPAGEETPG